MDNKAKALVLKRIRSLGNAVLEITRDVEILKSQCKSIKTIDDWQERFSSDYTMNFERTKEIIRTLQDEIDTALSLGNKNGSEIDKIKARINNIIFFYDY
jgi:hypothetical protein